MGQDILSISKSATKGAIAGAVAGGGDISLVTKAVTQGSIIGATDVGSSLDEMIQSKLEEAQESGVYSNKDLADLLQMAHRMRMDEIKAQAELTKAETTNIKTQNNVQINNESLPFGQGNYGKLMEKLLKEG